VSISHASGWWLPVGLPGTRPTAQDLFRAADIGRGARQCEVTNSAQSMGSAARVSGSGSHFPELLAHRLIRSAAARQCGSGRPLGADGLGRADRQPVRARSFRLLDARFDAVHHEADVTEGRTRGCLMRRDENRHAIVMVSGPVVDEVSRASAGDHGTSRHHLVEHRATWFIARPEAADVFTAVAQPLMQPVPNGLSLVSPGPAMNPSTDMDMYSTSRDMRPPIGSSSMSCGEVSTHAC
jgi:hypothetical protein